MSEVCCPPCETTRGVYGYSQLGPQDGDNRRGEKGERGVLFAVRDDTRCPRVLTAGPAGRG